MQWWVTFAVNLYLASGLHYDFLEIGTADFDTLAQQLSTADGITGISVEPVLSHLNRLPRAEGQHKVHAAISDADGMADLYVVRSEYMEPTCTAKTVQDLGIPYCLPWWFRATASLHSPSQLVEVHLGNLSPDAQMTIPVRTLTYRTLLEAYDVSSIEMLKIDTEGFDVQILRQVLSYGQASGMWPERIQFERNNLTVSPHASNVYGSLQRMYECLVPAGDEDVRCFRLRDILAGRPLTPQSFVSVSELANGFTDPWFSWAARLPERISVSFVRVAVPDAWPHSSLGVQMALWEVTLGDLPTVARNKRCSRLRVALEPGTVGEFPCGDDGRYVGVLAIGPSPLATVAPPKLPRVEVLGVVTQRGAVRVLTGRRCCPNSCDEPKWLFDGYASSCETRCRDNPACRFFTVYDSLWCSTSATCNEDTPTSLPSAITLSLEASLLLPIQLSNARQSSTSWGGTADRAIDGSDLAHFMSGHCSHTDEGDGGDNRISGPWWTAEVPKLPEQRAAAIGMVRVLGRWDCCEERLAGWEVRVGRDPNPWMNPSCGPPQGALGAGSRRSVYCTRPMDGQYVGIVMPGPEPLTLCEVESFAY